MPGKGQIAAAKQWQMFGQLEAILSTLGIRYQTIRSNTWSKTFPHGVEEENASKRYRLIKNARGEIAQRLFPGVDLKLNPTDRKPHDGMVDALLIAEHGYRQMREML